jgi:hypothetical protein
VQTFFPFPIEAGPFEAGYAGEPDRSGVPDAHKVLTALGAIGQLWDAKKSEEENARLEYSAEAVEVLPRCNLPIPPHLLMQRECSDGVAKAAQEGTNDSTMDTSCSASSAAGDDLTPQDIEYFTTHELDTDHVMVQDESVSSACNLRSIFFCKA